MDDASDSVFTPGSSPYGPPTGAAPAPAPESASAPEPHPVPSIAPVSPAPAFAPPAAATQLPPPPPYSLAPPTPSRPKNGFGVTSVWIGSFAFLFAANARGFTGIGVLLTLLAATFGVIALVNVNRLGKPRVAAIVGTSLAAFAVLATVFWALIRW